MSEHTRDDELDAIEARAEAGTRGDVSWTEEWAGTSLNYQAQVAVALGRIAKESTWLVARVRAAEAEVERLRFAEMLTHQECAVKKHPDWFIDYEHSLLCPWCLVESAEAERDRLRGDVELLTGRAEAAEDAENRLRAVVDKVRAVHDDWHNRPLGSSAWPYVHHWLRDLRAALAPNAVEPTIDQPRP